MYIYMDHTSLPLPGYEAEVKAWLIRGDSRPDSLRVSCRREMAKVADWKAKQLCLCNDAENSRSACFDLHNFIRTGIKYEILLHIYHYFDWHYCSNSWFWPACWKRFQHLCINVFLHFIPILNTYIMYMEKIIKDWIFPSNIKNSHWTKLKSVKISKSCILTSDFLKIHTFFMKIFIFFGIIMNYHFIVIKRI